MKAGYIRFVFFSLITAFVLAACSSISKPPTPTPAPLVILSVSGSGTITNVLEALKPAFESATPGYKLEVLPGNSTGSGVTGILEGVLDAAAMARAPKDEETAKNIKYYEMGLVGQAVIVHPTVTDVPTLNQQQIIDICSGKITNWTEVGGPNLQIVLYIRDEDETSTEGLRKAILGETPFAETATTLFSQSDMAYSVEGTPGAIGIAALPSMLATQVEVRAVAINGIKPDDPAYPILGSAGIGYLADHESDLQPLINWLSSEDGQSALKALGFVLPQ